MLDRDALGFAGRARSIDDVAQVIRGGVCWRIRRAWRLLLDQGLLLVQADHFRRHAIGQAVKVTAKTGRRQDKPDARIFRDKGDPVLWKAWIERDVGGIGLHDRQHRDIGPDRAAEEQSDPVTRPDAAFDQIAGQLIGFVFKIVIAQVAVFGDDRHATAAAILPQQRKTAFQTDDQDAHPAATGSRWGNQGKSGHLPVPDKESQLLSWQRLRHPAARSLQEPDQPGSRSGSCFNHQSFLLALISCQSRVWFGSEPLDRLSNGGCFVPP